MPGSLLSELRFRWWTISSGSPISKSKGHAQASYCWWQHYDSGHFVIPILARFSMTIFLASSSSPRVLCLASSIVLLNFLFVQWIESRMPVGPKFSSKAKWWKSCCRFDGMHGMLYPECVQIVPNSRNKKVKTAWDQWWGTSRVPMELGSKLENTCSATVQYVDASPTGAVNSWCFLWNAGYSRFEWNRRWT